MAQFLHFYPQYQLADLRSMPVGTFAFLLGGMFDVMDPESTEPLEDTVERATRAAAARHHKHQRRTRGWE